MVDTRSAKRRRLLGLESEASSSRQTVKNEGGRTCPSLRPSREADGKEAQTYDTFHPFQRLPPELRLQIWREVSQEVAKPFHPLRVRMYRGSERVYNPPSTTGKRSYTTKHVARLAALPDLGIVTKQRRALLAINQESRNEFMKLWDTTIPLERGRLLRFSYKHDLVYLDIVNASVIEDLIAMRENDELPEFTSAIGHLGLDMTPSMPLWMLNSHEDFEPQMQIVLCFRKIHTFSLVAFSRFEPEINWLSTSDVNWILSRTRNHRVFLRGFPAIESIRNYHNLQANMGNQRRLAMVRHDCAICTIHKCMFVNDALGSNAPRQAVVLSRSQLSTEESEFLRGIKHHFLVATHPYLAHRVPQYNNGTDLWWKNKPFEQEPIDTASSDEDDDEDDEEGHDHDHDDEDDDEPNSDNGGGHIHGMDGDSDNEVFHDHLETDEDEEFGFN